MSATQDTTPMKNHLSIPTGKRWSLKLPTWNGKSLTEIISFISAVTAVVALLLSLRQFNIQQEQEIKKPIRERQLALVFELSDVVSRIATLKPDDAERKRAESRFRELYWGPIVYVEDEGLRKWIIDFGNCLNEYHAAQEYAPAQTPADETNSDVKPTGCASADQQQNRLQELSLNLAIMQRKELGKEWDIDLKDIYKMRAQHTPTPLALP